ncbi:STAS domain-containing protein [Limnothrix sp. FACHB-881]|uniref:Anti-sigma factor antagonist n=1 Tax=Limnothrix redekei LRLZ20PSL1 TaxID=3112953 RepID=A0ABW7CDX5_9CYAN|nr:MULTISPECIES: STAS domain-containing protein [unclassified Limnothrix]OCQ94549.1 anti-anti-sigma factor [Limnothrix sp. P13C2]MBD2161828.1 STAS domain-containing protein [Limnothrix sp. FACHB-1083]MBD2192595.1 STAS domain-containing protein [Limnothrix sp. FACHB-1088]MBD2553087.1 STAS domain-containing protein [Limnothrix sp. FACHB-708]MBD2589102.1 STAS domain-containing protein [Limnothrix sp. FACHB-406]
MDRLSIVQPFGILDGKQAGPFRQEVSDQVQSGMQHILVDFQDVSFMDSSGLGALVLALKTARSAGAKLYLCSINDQVKMLFDLTSMDRVFEIYPDQESFMEHFNSL